MDQISREAMNSPEKKYSNHTRTGTGRERNLSFRIVLILLVTLLPVLAFFQYRWLDQLREAETVRTRANLKISADRFCEDFDRQLTQIYQNFQLEDKFSGKQEIISFLLDRYRQMNQSTDSDTIIKDLYLLQTGTSEKSLLFRLDPEKGSADISDWPAYLTFIRTAIQPDDKDNVFRLLQFTQTPWLIKNPLIITSISPPMIFGSGKKTDFYLVIIALNPSYLPKIFIPYLVKTHFGGFEGYKFDLAIARKGDTDSLYYASDPELTAADFADADVHADLGRWRMHGVFIATAVTENQNIDIRNFTSGLKQTEISLKVITRDSVDKKEYARYLISEVPGWELRIRNRSGSLESAIRATHVRNLIIGNGIIALLGVSIVLVFILSRRARKLAARQMEFVAGVSHELRTPLAVIRSAGENLADGLIRDPDQAHRYGRLIRDEGRRLSDLVEQILAFGGIQNGKQTISKESCNINALLNEILGQYEEEFNESGAVVESQTDPGLPEIKCDRNGMIMVLKNLISNAMKYSGEKIVIHISTLYKKEDNTVHIKLCDRGIGISGEDIKHIFEPFYRSGSVIAAQIRGTGLGLSLARKILRLHGGDITVTSSRDDGSCFEIVLPAGDRS
jgi:signal transduction histidine kinase